MHEFQTSKISRHKIQQKAKKTKVRTTKMGELVYTDTCGLLFISYVNGELYFKTHIGNFSCPTAVFLMKSKTQTLQNIQ